MKTPEFWRFPKIWEPATPLLCREPRFFVLHSMNQDHSCELSKSTFQQFFWVVIIRVDPCDFFWGGGWSKFSGMVLPGRNWQKKMFWSGLRRASLPPWHMVEVISVYLVGHLIALLAYGAYTADWAECRAVWSDISGCSYAALHAVLHALQGRGSSVVFSRSATQRKYSAVQSVTLDIQIHIFSDY